MSSSRKSFLKNSILSSLALAAPWTFPDFAGAGNAVQPPSGKRKFTMQLNGGLIGVNADQLQQINLAYKYGFESVAASPGYLGKLSADQLQALQDDMKEKKLSFGLGMINIEFRKSEEIFRNSLSALPASCAALQRAGVTRAMTWIMSNHPELNYLQNFRQHAVRLREIAGVLKDYNIRFGLEYVGPKSIWSAGKFPFIHTMAELKELIAAIGQTNVGIHLDTAHWFTAGESVDDILSLSNREVVGCDLNDALKGYSPIEDQPGYQRELPAATGVIDTKGFLEALIMIGYDGFVQAEPFNDALNKLDNDAAVQKTAAAMKKAFALIS